MQPQALLHASAYAHINQFLFCVKDGVNTSLDLWPCSNVTYKPLSKMGAIDENWCELQQGSSAIQRYPADDACTEPQRTTCVRHVYLVVQIRYERQLCQWRDCCCAPALLGCESGVCFALGFIRCLLLRSCCRTYSASASTAAARNPAQEQRLERACTWLYLSLAVVRAALLGAPGTKPKTALRLTSKPAT